MGRAAVGVGFACLLMSCSTGARSSAEDANLPPDTYRLDFSQYEDGGWPAGAVTLVNASLAFSFDLSRRSQLVTREAPDLFAVINNRLPCQNGELSTERNDDLAQQGFARADIIPKEVVRLHSVSVELPASSGPQDICYAYRTSDGIWHGHFEPLRTTHDATILLNRITLAVQADPVDVMGVVVYQGVVRSITYVATRDPS